MIENEEVLKIISNEIKDSICNLDIVTPTLFSSYFSKYALEHSVKLDEETVTNQYLNDRISNLDKIQNQTSKNVNILEKNTTSAISAIKKQDEDTLNAILKETNNLKKEMLHLKESLYKDELTSVYNRKWLHDNCLADDKKTFKSSGVLVLVDLNYFKLVNDNYGHIMGDKVLIFIANQLKVTKGYVTRYGGDEFVILFEHSESVKDISKRFNDLRESILKKHLKAKNISFKISYSFGLKSYKQGDQLTSTIESADENMYEDKINIKKRIKGIKV